MVEIHGDLIDQPILTWDAIDPHRCGIRFKDVRTDADPHVTAKQEALRVVNVPGAGAERFDSNVAGDWFDRQDEPADAIASDGNASLGVDRMVDQIRPRGKHKGKPKGPDKLWGGFWAVVSGFTSFMAHAGGPPLNVYLLPQGLEKRLFVGTVAVFFMVVNWMKLVPYALLGQFHTGNLTTSLALAPLAPAGIWLGVWLQSRVSDRVFYGVCYALLLVTGLKLGYDGVVGVFAAP